MANFVPLPDRSHEIRLVVAPRSRSTLSAARESVAEVLGTDWRVEWLTARGRLLLLRSWGVHLVGTDDHARASHEAAVTLIESGRFARVEADVPIRGYADQETMSAPEGDRQGAADSAAVPLYWVHETLRWAQALETMPEPVRGGVGISIAQPDTGYTLHPNLGTAGLDLDRDRDVISNDDDALDDMEPNPIWPLPFPGHGTATASVVAGHGDPAVGIVGLTPAAKLVPFRATESVV